MTEHTPRPWIRADRFIYALNAKGSNQFHLSVDNGNGKDGASVPELRANARLIAGSPDLLATAKVVSALFHPDDGEGALGIALRGLRFAIREAEDHSE